MAWLLWGDWKEEEEERPVRTPLWGSGREGGGSQDGENELTWGTFQQRCQDTYPTYSQVGVGSWEGVTDDFQKHVLPFPSVSVLTVGTRTSGASCPGVSRHPVFQESSIGMLSNLGAQELMFIFPSRLGDVAIYFYSLIFILGKVFR